MKESRILEQVQKIIKNEENLNKIEWLEENETFTLTLIETNYCPEEKLIKFVYRETDYDTVLINISLGGRHIDIEIL